MEQHASIETHRVIGGLVAAGGGFGRIRLVCSDWFALSVQALRAGRLRSKIVHAARELSHDFE